MNKCLYCESDLEKPKKRRYRKLINGLICFKHYAHPDDVEEIERFIRELFIKRGCIE